MATGMAFQCRAAHRLSDRNKYISRLISQHARGGEEGKESLLGEHFKLCFKILKFSGVLVTFKSCLCFPVVSHTSPVL